MQALRVRIASLGGRARARNLSPTIRSLISKKAADGRWAKRRGEPSHDEFVERLVGKIRATDPDLARFVEIVNRLPIKDQESIFKLLPIEKKELVCHTTEALCPAR